MNYHHQSMWDLHLHFLHHLMSYYPGHYVFVLVYFLYFHHKICTTEVYCLLFHQWWVSLDYFVSQLSVREQYGFSLSVGV